jgi:hypothetical protein
MRFREKLAAEWKSFCTWGGGPKRELSRWETAFSIILVGLLLLAVILFGIFTGRI